MKQRVKEMEAEAAKVRPLPSRAAFLPLLLSREALPLAHPFLPPNSPCRPSD